MRCLVPILALLAACGGARAPERVAASPEAAERPATMLAADEPVVTGPAGALAPARVLRALYALPSGTLVPGPSAPSWAGADAISRIGARALAPIPESGAILRALDDPSSTDEPSEIRLHEGLAWIASVGSFRSARTVRVSGTRATPLATRDLVLGVAPLGADREAWIVARAPSGVQRIAIVDARGAITAVDPPPLVGPVVPGLSEIARPHCASPSAARIAGRDGAVAVLLTECHRDAPLRIARFAADRAGPPAIDTLPPLDFGPEAMALLADGRAVVAGATPSSVAIERADHTWEIRRTSFSAVTIVSLAIAPDGAIWTLALGSGDDGHDRWVVEREGVEVELPEVGAVRYAPRALATHAELGMVVAGGSLSGSHLFAE